MRPFTPRKVLEDCVGNLHQQIAEHEQEIERMRAHIAERSAKLEEIRSVLATFEAALTSNTVSE